MNSRALKQLRKLVKIEGVSRKDGTLARVEALEDWIDTWIEEISIEQTIIKKNLTSEDEDFIKYYMATKMGEELMEYCVEIESTPTKIKTVVKSLRR